MRRRNGLGRPYSKAQISAWFALIASMVQFPLFVSPILPLAASIPVTIAFFMLVATVIYYGGLTVLIDPVDVHLCRYWKDAVEPGNEWRYPPPSGTQCNSLTDRLYLKANQERQSQSIQLPEESMKQCWICDTQVAEHSMHCKFCNKCVYNFDHHCMWLNTCIGKANYQFFYNTMLALFAMEVFHMVVQIALVIDSFLDGSTNQRADEWLNASIDHSVEVIYAILIFFIVFNAVSLFLIGQLIWFHIGLQKQNLTTYQFIVKDHKRKRELEKRLGDLQRERIIAMDHALRDGQTCYYRRLRCGGACRQMNCPSCDVLDLPGAPPEPDPEAGFAAALGGGVYNNNNDNKQGFGNGNRDSTSGDLRDKDNMTNGVESRNTLNGTSNTTTNNDDQKQPETPTTTASSATHVPEEISVGISNSQNYHDQQNNQEEEESPAFETNFSEFSDFGSSPENIEAVIDSTAATAPSATIDDTTYTWDGQSSVDDNSTQNGHGPTDISLETEQTPLEAPSPIRPTTNAGGEQTAIVPTEDLVQVSSSDISVQSQSQQEEVVERNIS